MRNCVVYGNRRQTSGNEPPTGLFTSGTNIKIYNNTVYNNEYMGISVSGGSGEIRNNISYGNGNQNIASGKYTASNNLTSNPNFVNGGASDFRLQSNSPAINAGVNLVDVPTDKDGVLRPQGGAYDIGAYEYVGGASNTPLNAPSDLRVTAN
jgi:hypothetical protein